MSKTLPCSVGAADAPDSSGDDLTVVVDLPVLQLEALNVDMPALDLQTVELESPLDSDEDGLTCVDCGESTYDECEDCGDPLCCDDVCSYCAL